MRPKLLKKTKLKILNYLINRPHFRVTELEKYGVIFKDDSMIIDSRQWQNQAANLVQDDFPEIFEGQFINNITQYKIRIKDEEKARKLLKHNEGNY